MFKSVIGALVGFLIIGLIQPSSAPAELSVGAQLGANFTGTVNLDASTTTRFGQAGDNTVDNSLFSGLTVEYYFNNKGFLKYDWPTWMKNFSIALDITHNWIAFGHQTCPLICNDCNWGNVALPSFKGWVLTSSCLFKYRYPILIQPDFPDGRLFFYIGVGPGISFNYLEANNNNPCNKQAVGHGFGNAFTLVSECGFSLFVVKDVSIDLFFRYRHFTPNYEFNIGVDGPPLYIKFDNNTYNAALRIAFHF
jgi:outer membrane protein W